MLDDDHPLLAQHSWHHLDEQALAALAQRLAAWLRADPSRANLRLTLHGELGAGKTTWTRHLLRALGVQGRIQSPTFALVEPYEVTLGATPVTVMHADLYRLSDPREWLDAGLAEPMDAPGLKLIEWPERAGRLLGTVDAALHLQHDDEHHRHLTWHAYTAAGFAALQALQSSR
ncbi:tRNA (adenosine(37)-N6)-threonylcarbamoyltransferase complex ATPase subunit type 1 TsaE [Tepidimonas aquatica]|uniref:tRNA threonylcarbamoyladenosine biosynthesis protein TsaE n=1 Tax=Tepidimonas aquatica TaxID=247482 RepID=A0A554WVK4_9BURK|nr:tRNA (adenosine(37)-N6)-threonylcarbamoyltransferase complex ATPase subunit type 1 TsaE [Tepidimonas aquatica]TSE27606.1 tRNA threonylcarbamoyladenosine biosynthesis protein TsaE [Tepidimonas aquatica]